MRGERLGGSRRGTRRGAVDRACCASAPTARKSCTGSRSWVARSSRDTSPDRGRQSPSWTARGSASASVKAPASTSTSSTPRRSASTSTPRGLYTSTTSSQNRANAGDDRRSHWGSCRLRKLRRPNRRRLCSNRRHLDAGLPAAKWSLAPAAARASLYARKCVAVLLTLHNGRSHARWTGALPRPSSRFCTAVPRSDRSSAVGVV